MARNDAADVGYLRLESPDKLDAKMPNTVRAFHLCVVLWATSNTVHILQICVVGLFFSSTPLHCKAAPYSFFLEVVKGSKQTSSLSNKSGLPSFPHVFGARISSKLRGVWRLDVVSEG